MAEKRDYYEVLGIPKTATEAEIKKAFRTTAKKYHPDMHPGDKECEEKFKEAQEAYAVLSDPEKRRQYDQFGHAAFDGGAGGAGGFDFSGMDMGDIFGDIFGDFFGGGRRNSNNNGPAQGASVRLTVRITFEEAVFGCSKELEFPYKEECKTCHGTGAKPGTSPETCSKCGGKGKVVYSQQSLFGMMRTQSPCPDCHGTGKHVRKACHVCHGQGYTRKTSPVEIKIPAGISSGQQLRVAGKGSRGSNGGPNGDLYIEINVQPHKYFVRDGKDIYLDIPVSAVDATIGTSVDVPTIDGDVSMKIPAGTQDGTKLRLKGKGVVDLRGGKKGDEIVTVRIKVNDDLSRKEKELYKQLQELQESSKSETLWTKFKNQFK